MLESFELGSKTGFLIGPDQRMFEKLLFGRRVHHARSSPTWQLSVPAGGYAIGALAPLAPQLRGSVPRIISGPLTAHERHQW